MIKTGKRLSWLWGWLICLAWLPAVSAQSLTLEATLSETKVFTGEQFTLTITVQSASQHNVELPVIPDFRGARVLTGTPSRSTSISIINGRTTRSTAYSYTLIAESAGTYRLPAIDMTIDDQTMQTNSVSFEVIERGSLSSEGRQQYPDIFLQVELDEERPVAGQQLIASVVLYFKQNVDVTSFQPAFGWRTDGFWKEELENISQPRAESTILGGVRYRKAVLLRYALFPSRSGDLTLSEYELTAGVRTRTDRNDPFGSFFGSGTNQRRISLQSEPVTVPVRALPERTDAIWMNAVGDLSVSRSISRSEIRAGDSIELETVIEGSGNIPLINRPVYNLPDGFDLFSPQERSNVERRGYTIRGDKVFSESLVSRAPGTYTIPAERIAVFNPETRRYRYTTLPALTIEVLPAPQADIVAASGSSSAAPQPITGLAVWYTGGAQPFYTAGWFWLFLALPFVALIAGLYRKKLTDRLANDSRFRRAHHAYNTAIERLDKAKTHLTQDEPKLVYHELHKSLSGYIVDQLGLPEAGLSDRDLIESIHQQSVNGEITKTLQRLLDKCSTISYAPAGSKEDISADIRAAESLIKTLKRSL
ncbi:MAG: BatD family protein [Balneolaceae bacterium]